MIKKMFLKEHFNNNYFYFKNYYIPLNKIKRKININKLF
ncbi:MAG: hypothetical protein PWQ35_167 [Patescibacteria group bacterium]|nr:hypothetical protein [Patescibacteria group bacterium]